tara:strand:- start:791 stop:1141 length:351 start_codon:yes stop_codon:yes gene_type:complete
MLNKISKLVVVVGFGLIVSGCANSDFSHRYLMRGQVISVTDGDIYVCVGLDDGAQVGQILESYSYVMNDDNDEGADFFKKQKTGQVRVEELVDDHFAKVSVLEGVVKKHDLVSLIQ